MKATNIEGDFLDIISSPQNSLVKKLKLLSTSKGRKLYGEFIVEGNKFALNIPKGWKVEHLIFSQSFAESLSDMSDYDKPIILKDSIFSSVSNTVTPSGVISVVKIRNFEIRHILESSNKFVIIACSLQDPGNLGTLIRTANAAGAAGVIVSKDSADIWSPKVVRSTAGSLFNIPIVVESIDIAAAKLKEEGLKLIATDLSAEKSPYQVDLKQPLALMIGNESKGLSSDLITLADIRVKLPMNSDVESLNASVASGILMYEVLRQRMKIC